jgi:hypothetical protein
MAAHPGLPLGAARLWAAHPGLSLGAARLWAAHSGLPLGAAHSGLPARGQPDHPEPGCWLPGEPWPRRPPTRVRPLGLPAASPAGPWPSDLNTAPRPARRPRQSPGLAAAPGHRAWPPCLATAPGHRAWPPRLAVAWPPGLSASPAAAFADETARRPALADHCLPGRPVSPSPGPALGRAGRGSRQLTVWVSWPGSESRSSASIARTDQVCSPAGGTGPTYRRAPVTATGVPSSDTS